MRVQHHEVGRVAALVAHAREPRPHARDPHAFLQVHHGLGCLAQGPGDVWMLTSSSTPALANDQPPTAATLETAAAQLLGSKTVRLVSANPFNPDAHKGHKMHAKGLIYHGPDRDRINLISLEMLSQSCGS